MINVLLHIKNSHSGKLTLQFVLFVACRYIEGQSLLPDFYWTALRCLKVRTVPLTVTYIFFPNCITSVTYLTVMDQPDGIKGHYLQTPGGCGDLYSHFSRQYSTNRMKSLIIAPSILHHVDMGDGKRLLNSSNNIQHFFL